MVRSPAHADIKMPGRHVHLTLAAILILTNLSILLSLKASQVGVQSVCTEPAGDATKVCSTALTPSSNAISAYPFDDTGGATAQAAGKPPILWLGDHERGDSGDWWSPAPTHRERRNCGGEYNNAPAYSEVADVARSGQYGMRMRVPDMNTGGALGVRLFRWCESRENGELYYSAWFYIPEQVQVKNWWLLMQWKSNGSVNPKFTVHVKNRADGQMYLNLGRGNDSGGGSWGQDIKNIPVGQWFQIEVFYKKATDSSGRVTLWQDGEQIVDLTGVKTANSNDLGWSLANYGQGITPSDVTVYADDAVISTVPVR